MNNERIQQLYDLGLKFNGQNFFGTGLISDFNVHHTEIVCDTDEDWGNKIHSLQSEKERRENRYVFLEVNVLFGGLQVSIMSIHKTKCKDLLFFAHRRASKFYGDPDVCRVNEAWHSYSGRAVASVKLVRQISKEHYEILSQYLP